MRRHRDRTPWQRTARRTPRPAARYAAHRHRHARGSARPPRAGLARPDGELTAPVSSLTISPLIVDDGARDAADVARTSLTSIEETSTSVTPPAPTGSSASDRPESTAFGSSPAHSTGSSASSGWMGGDGRRQAPRHDATDLRGAHAVGAAASERDDLDLRRGATRSLGHVRHSMVLRKAIDHRARSVPPLEGRPHTTGPGSRRRPSGGLCTTVTQPSDRPCPVPPPGAAPASSRSASSRGGRRSSQFRRASAWAATSAGSPCHPPAALSTGRTHLVVVEDSAARRPWRDRDGGDDVPSGGENSAHEQLSEPELIRRGQHGAMNSEATNRANAHDDAERGPSAVQHARWSGRMRAPRSSVAVRRLVTDSLPGPRP